MLPDLPSDYPCWPATTEDIAAHVWYVSKGNSKIGRAARVSWQGVGAYKNYNEVYIQLIEVDRLSYIVGPIDDLDEAYDVANKWCQTGKYRDWGS